MPQKIKCQLIHFTNIRACAIKATRSTSYLDSYI